MNEQQLTITEEMRMNDVVTNPELVAAENRAREEYERRFAGKSEKEVLKEFRKMIKQQNRIEPYVRQHAKIGRNEQCPCGSGKKFKKCCMHDYNIYVAETEKKALDRR